jgi:hypothetical protein
VIWYNCKGCGKKQKRPPEAAGTLVFCTCGVSNRVPWESTAEPEPDTLPEKPRRPRAPPDLDERREERDTSRRSEPQLRNPAYCLNHDEATPDHKCADCGERFCPRCVVSFQGVVLCGPCKNFRVRGLQRPLSITPMSIAAPVLGLVVAIFLFFIFVIPASLDAATATRSLLAVLGLMVALIALGASVYAVWQVDSRAGRGGRGLAMSGVAFGLASSLWAMGVLVTLAVRAIHP